MNNFTSIEQSKKLVELGLNPDTADMCYLSQTPQGEPIFFERPAVKGGDTEQYYKTSLPCWSVGALLEVMPSEYELIKNSDNTYEISVGRIIAMVSENDETVVNLIVSMVCWLLENNYIEKIK